MNAQQITDIANASGTDGVIRALGISRSQAERIIGVAKRAVAEGREIPTDMIPQGTRRYDRRPPTPGHALTDAEVASLGNVIDRPEMHSYEYQEALRRQYVVDQNTRNKIAERDPRLAGEPTIKAGTFGSPHDVY